jgi:hypothetical protein
MTRAILKLALLLVGAHLVLGAILLVIEAVHGINDQDVSFAVAMLFYYVNLPAVWLLRSAGATPGVGVVLIAGIVQWTVLAIVLAVGYRALRAIAGRTHKGAEQRAGECKW